MDLLTVHQQCIGCEFMSTTIDTSIQYIKGVGPKLGAVLAKRGVRTVGDLLEWYPRTYEDRRRMREISSLKAGQSVSLVAEIASIQSRPMGGRGRKYHVVVIRDSSGQIPCVYFRIPHKGYFERLNVHDRVRVVGKVIEYRGRLEFHHPEIHHFQEGGAEVQDALIPLYTQTEQMNPTKLRRIIDSALMALDVTDDSQKQGNSSAILKPRGSRNEVSRIYTSSKDMSDRPWEEFLPQWMCRDFDLLDWPRALREIHQPPQESADLFLSFKAPAQRRIIFEEFFWMELALALRRAGVKRDLAPSIEFHSSRVEQLTQELEFQLTQAQWRAFTEIREDLHKDYPMHRLVQGDVGSGKTLVALMAAIQAIDSGAQVSLMVPTEILAEQHYANCRRRLQPLGIKVALLVGQMTASAKREVYERLESGDLDLVIGTQALIQSEVRFKKLGLVIVDEQHRFGVEQRMNLRGKGFSPHFLLMTATPIPRSLAMTVYGDLDISIIDELPAGRKAIATRVTFSSKRNLIWDFVEKQVREGRQAYVVYPLVEESEKIDLMNAQEEFIQLKDRFPQFALGLLHGKMKSIEKDEVMSRFRSGEIQILVSTTVIEVGVDVPNANIMVIEHSERFGLSQLHQLRGRVGRGSYKSYCILVLGHAVSPESRQRVEIMEKNSDGFKIAEEDLALRGPGEFLGTRQSGLAGFKLGNLLRDLSILKNAREAAFKLISMDPHLQKPEHQKVRTQWEKKQLQFIG